MWYEDLPDGESWATLWTGYVRCPTCSGIRSLHDPCAVCGADLPSAEEKITLPDGSEMSVGPALMGGERAYEDYVYLSLLQREWNRMQRDVRTLHQSQFTTEVSLGAPIVLIFWSYFETRIDRLWTDALSGLPLLLSKDLLDRHSSVKARLGSFYKNFLRLDLLRRPRTLRVRRPRWISGPSDGEAEHVRPRRPTEHGR